jgi:HD-like signal output (HDOD) protein
MNMDRSSYEAHCRRTAALANEIGRGLGLESGALVQAALLHDSLDPVEHSHGLGRLAWRVVGGDRAGLTAAIVRLANLVDDSLEGLEFEYQETDSILEEIRSFAVLEGIEPELVDRVSALRCRHVPAKFELPVGAHLACEVIRTLRQPAELDLPELESLAMRDGVLAGSLIGVANSAAHGRSRPVTTVSRALSRLGAEAGRKIMLAAAMRPLFASAGLARLWSHSLSSAPLTAALADRTGLLPREEGLLLGLVHDLGSVAIETLPREVLEPRQRLLEGGCPAAYVERLMLGCDHGEIGAGILAGWHFPAAFVDAVRFHHQPERAATPLASLAYVAEFWSGQDEDLPSFGRVDKCLDRLGLSLENLTELAIHDSTLHALKAVA